VFLLKVSVGFLLVGLGLAYLFQPATILRMNAFMRERVFRDSHVLLSNKRIGATMLAVGFLLLVVTLQFSR
jgi:hypothetical protein